MLYNPWLQPHYLQGCLLLVSFGGCFTIASKMTKVSGSLIGLPGKLNLETDMTSAVFFGLQGKLWCILYKYEYVYACASYPSSLELNIWSPPFLAKNDSGTRIPPSRRSFDKLALATSYHWDVHEPVALESLNSDSPNGGSSSTGRLAGFWQIHEPEIHARGFQQLQHIGKIGKFGWYDHVSFQIRRLWTSMWYDHVALYQQFLHLLQPQWGATRSIHRGKALGSWPQSSARNQQRRCITVSGDGSWNCVKRNQEIDEPGGFKSHEWKKKSIPAWVASVLMAKCDQQTAPFAARMRYTFLVVWTIEHISHYKLISHWNRSNLNCCVWCLSCQNGKHTRIEPPAKSV